MLSGHLQIKKEHYYAVLNCKRPDGHRFQKWISTGIAVKKGSKRAAEEALIRFRTTYNEYGEPISGNGSTDSKPAPRKGRKKSPDAQHPSPAPSSAPYGDMLFSPTICFPGFLTRNWK